MTEGYKIYQIRNFIKKIENIELNPKNFKTIMYELAAASAIHPNHNLLVDVRKIKPLKNFGEVLNIVSEAAKFHRAFRNKIAVIITDEQGMIIYSDLTNNYRIRPEPEDFIEVLNRHALMA